MQVIPAGAWLTSGKDLAYAGWTPPTHGLFLFLALSGWTPATPEIHPAPVRLTPDHHKSTVLDAPDEAAKLLLILRVVSRSLWRTLTGAGTPERPHWGAAFSSHTLGRARCSSGLRLFRMGRKEAGLRGES
ncbi:hypothetical protein OVX87_32660 [Klebsiella pneumoniae]|nr:hypothetical protein [Klebsiella pneumoniae]